VWFTEESDQSTEVIFFVERPEGHQKIGTLKSGRGGIFGGIFFFGIWRGESPADGDDGFIRSQVPVAGSTADAVVLFFAATNGIGRDSLRPPCTSGSYKGSQGIEVFRAAGRGGDLRHGGARLLLMWIGQKAPHVLRVQSTGGCGKYWSLTWSHGEARERAVTGLAVHFRDEQPTGFCRLQMLGAKSGISGYQCFRGLRSRLLS